MVTPALQGRQLEHTLLLECHQQPSHMPNIGWPTPAESSEPSPQCKGASPWPLRGRGHSPAHLGHSVGQQPTGGRPCPQRLMLQSPSFTTWGTPGPTSSALGRGEARTHAHPPRARQTQTWYFQAGQFSGHQRGCLRAKSKLPTLPTSSCRLWLLPPLGTACLSLQSGPPTCCSRFASRSLIRRCLCLGDVLLFSSGQVPLILQVSDTASSRKPSLTPRLREELHYDPLTPAKPPPLCSAH